MTKKNRYIDICKKHKGIPLFMQPWWLDAVCTEWDAAVATKGDLVTGIWPYPVEHKMGVNMLRTPLLTPYLGPHVFYPDDLKESKLDSHEHDTIADLMKQLPTFKVWHLAVEPGIKQVGLFKKYGLRPQVQQTFTLALNKDESVLLSDMKDTMRRNLKQTAGEITITESTAALPELFAFHKQTLSKKGNEIPYTLADLERIMQACTANNAARLWVAKNGKTTEAIIWQVFDDHCSYYFMGGQNPEASGYKSMSLLLWHAMKEAKKMGHHTFDLEGSMDEGVERFFRNFGGQRNLYIVLYKNDSLLWKMKKMMLG